MSGKKYRRGIEPCSFHSAEQSAPRRVKRSHSAVLSCRGLSLPISGKEICITQIFEPSQTDGPLWHMRVLDIGRCALATSL